MEDVKFKVKLKYRMLLDKEALSTAETVKLAYLGVYTVPKGHSIYPGLDNPLVLMQDFKPLCLCRF